jgi:uncharacterized membrane protein
MTLPPDPAPAPPGRDPARRDREAAKLVYILYLVGFALPVTAAAGVILAYAKRGGGDPVAESHFTFQIRSFWIGLLATILGGVLMVVLIGWLVVGVWMVWALMRFITGLLKLSEGAAVTDPEGWGFRA